MKLVFIAFLVILVVSTYCEEMVLTPGGYLPQSCVHQVEEEDAIVNPFETGHVHISYSNGSIKVLPPCNKEKILSQRSTTQQSGWVAYAFWNASAVVTSYVGTWIVPPKPRSLDTQTLFTFPGLVNVYTSVHANDRPSQAVSIIQPVLQWGPSVDGGGSYWAIGSWWVSANYTAIWSPLKKVNSGDTILGTMVYNNNQTWSINTFDQTTKASTTLNINVGVHEHYAFVSLEVYNVGDCKDYPNGVIPYTGLSIKNKGKKYDS